MYNKSNLWSDNETSRLIAIVKDAGTDAEGFRKAITILTNRSVRACALQYYKAVGSHKPCTASKFKSISTNPSELVKLPGSNPSLPITIRSGRATILVVDGKITITT